MNLTDAQRQVVETDQTPLLVQAGPGSGKTRTLVAKFLALVEAGAAPERVLALTFSTKAAAEIRHRLEEHTRASHGQLWVSTFHSFGYAIVDRYRAEAGLPRAFRLLTGFKEWVLVRDVLARLPGDSPLGAAATCRGLVGHVANAIGALKQGLVTPDALRDALPRLPADDRPLLGDLATAFAGYEDELRARRHFDYRDLILRARHLLRTHEDVRRRVRDGFDAVLLDEVQDIAPAQLALVESLVAGSPLARRTTAFGDVDQSIYGFRGALPRAVVEGFRRTFDGARDHTLRDNFRAAPALIDMARRVLPGAAMQPAARPDDESGAPADIVVVEASTSLAEATAVARELRRAHRAGHPWRAMAVLCRSLKRDASAIEGELDRLGIPYRVHGNASFYRNPAVAYLVSYLLALATDIDDPDDAPLRRVLASPVAGLPQLPLARFLDRVVRRDRHAGRYLWFLRHLLEREDPDRWPIWRPDKHEGDEDDDKREAQAELEREAREQRYARARPPYFYEQMTDADKQAFFDVHRRFLRLRGRARSGRDALPELVAAVAAGSGLTDWILARAERDPRQAERDAANVSKLHAMVREFTEIAAAHDVDGSPDAGPPTLADLAAHLRSLLLHFAHESEVDAPAEDLYEPEDAVSVMTVHQSKGLEFDVVAVPHLVVGAFPAPPRPGVVLGPAASAALEAAFPDYRDPARADPVDHFDEERRLTYVALTRARRRLILGWAHRYDEDDDTCAPSPFLIDALGGSEAAFWDDVHERGLAPGERLRELADALPTVRYLAVHDRDIELDEVGHPDEADVALRQLVQHGDDAVRAAVRRALDQAPPDVPLDRAFIDGAPTYAPEPPRPLDLPRDVVLSASRLADYRACPRQFFYAKLLHLERRTHPAALFGTIVHAVLEDFHRAHPDKHAFADDARRLRDELHEALVARLEEEADRFGSRFEQQRQLAGVGTLVDNVVALQREEPLRYVVACELDLEFDATDARVVAKIDRVVADAPDLDDASEVLIGDYKTSRGGIAGKGRTLAKRIRDGKELQLATYARALREARGVDATHLSLIYLRHASEWRPGTLAPTLSVVDRDDARGTDWWGLNGRLWTDRGYIAPDELDDAWAAIDASLSEIFTPDNTFDITPGKHCRYCAFSAICGKEA